MFKQLVVLFALVAVASARLTPEEERLYIQKGRLEEKILSESRWTTSPNDMLKMVTELEDNIYKKLPLPEKPSTAERWTRELVNIMYTVGQTSMSNCKAGLLPLNMLVNKTVKQHANLKGVVKMLEHYRKKQMDMCPDEDKVQAL